MASKTRRNFTDEFSAETVALLEGSGRLFVAGGCGAWHRAVGPLYVAP